MHRISGTTRLAGVIGKPLVHTLSPVMHNTVYEFLELDWVYIPLRVEDEIGLRRFFAAARSMGFVGFNITMPFKVAAMELCDEVAMAANMAGAVNAVHCVDGRLIGYNTDGRALLEALVQDLGFQPEGARVVVIGAGGAAGSALVALALAKVDSITVVNRTAGRAEELLGRASAHFRGIDVVAVAPFNAQAAVESADLIINCTPVGMRPGDEAPIDVSWLHSGQLVYDMVYGTSEPTRLVAAATLAGAKASDGLGMLVAQAAMSVDIWSGSVQNRAPRDVMRSAAEAELSRRRSTPGEAL